MVARIGNVEPDDPRNSGKGVRGVGKLWEFGLTLFSFLFSSSYFFFFFSSFF